MTVFANGGRHAGTGTPKRLLGVVDGIIARGDKPTAYSTYNLKEVAPAKTQLMSETREWPRIAVVGAGAVGGYFGGMFARAGAPTVFIGRKHFADAVSSKGLVLDKSMARSESAPWRQSRWAPFEIARSFCFSVKANDTAATATQMAPIR